MYKAVEIGEDWFAVELEEFDETEASDLREHISAGEVVIFAENIEDIKELLGKANLEIIEDQDEE